MNTILSSRLPPRSPSSTKPLLVSNRAVTLTGQRPSSSHTSSLPIIDSTADSYSAPHWKTVTMSRFAGLARLVLVYHRTAIFSISFLPFPFYVGTDSLAVTVWRLLLSNADVFLILKKIGLVSGNLTCLPCGPRRVSASL
jgi:hypothetical protein